jgi:copper chaperone
MTNQTLSVPDISCGHCKMSIEGALNELSGVTAAEVHIDPRSVDVSWNEESVGLEAIIEAIEGQGYEVAR